MFALPRNAARRTLLLAAMLSSPLLAEAARLDPALSSRLPALGAAGSLEVIVSFEGDGAPAPAQVAALRALGLGGVTLQSLPIAGVRANRAQIDALLARDDVRSVWFNAPLEHENKEATALTGVDKLRADRNLRNAGLPYSGRGVAVLINDSGIDGTHPDVKFGDHVVQNVLAQTNLRSNSDLLPVSFIENVNNTDIGAGHGTHVAGIVGGTGAASTGGQFEGVAPGADLVGYGSGAALFVLDTLGGFDYALTHQAQYGIRVVSNSFGNTSDTGTDFDPDDPTNIATKKLTDRGVIVVFSAGNSGAGEGTITGNFKKAPWVVAVAAGDKQGRLADFSSRGEKGNGGEVVIDGESFSWEDRPTVTAPGVHIYSARASTGDGLDLLSIETTIAEIGPGQAPYYTAYDGTSMAAPHISGVVALMLEANPALDWRDVKAILQQTASNIPGREPWEAGAGYVNAYAAVQAARGLGQFGATANFSRSFNAQAQISTASSVDYTFDFSPAGPTGEVSFQVGADIAMVNARANVAENTVALVLTDPAGRTYGSSIALPVLGQNVAASAPGLAGTWKLTARGVGSVSGVALDPAGVSNGYGVPGPITANVKQLRTDGYSGLADIGGHAAQGFIELAVRERLVDSDADGNFRPDAVLTRAKLADFLAMGGGVRQSDPLAGPSFADVPDSSNLFPFAEAAAGRGAALRDTYHADAGLVRTANRLFEPNKAVTREHLAYALVQALGLGAQARAHSGDVTALSNGTRYTLTDQAQIEPALRGYVQLALDLQLLPAKFAMMQGPFDLQPKLSASFAPRESSTRAAYAAAATRYQSVSDQNPAP
jgi:serine protease AprX